jgi:hypothetical protein
MDGMAWRSRAERLCGRISSLPEEDRGRDPRIPVSPWTENSIPHRVAIVQRVVKFLTEKTGAKCFTG